MLVIALRWWGAREELRKGSGRGLFLSPEKKYLYNFYAVPPPQKKRDVGISYCRLLLHDTLLREDAFRTGTSDTPICECGLDMESAKHFLLHCTRHQEARNELQLSLQEITSILIMC